MPRYRFSRYVVSPGRRTILRDGVEQPLIPRYFDLLVFLIEHRHEAVHRRDIFDRVWSDVVVSDSALSQAVRTIRRTLEDDSREPRFIRTVSRHGYRFVFDGVVVEEEDDGAWTPVVDSGETSSVATNVPPPAPASEPDSDPFEPLLRRLTETPATAADEEEQREAAELLHGLGTAQALIRLGTRPGHPLARALLRDTRWDSPAAGQVPLVGAPGMTSATAAVIRLRLRRAARIAAARWAAASIGGGVAGIISGAVGGLMLAAVPGSTAPASLAVVLAAVGGVCGALGGAGVGAGLAAAEAVARSRRAAALVVGGAVGGGLVGAAVQWLALWTLTAVFGMGVTTGGGLEGVVIGGAAGLGYALAAPRAEGGLAALRGAQRLRAIGNIVVATALAALALTLAGRPLVGGTIHKIAQQSRGAKAVLTPLGRLVGEPDFGPLTRALIGTGEGALFGVGLGLGLTRRP
jgi:DNA-binding winged helix-turn-helix (wHTH) protein